MLLTSEYLSSIFNHFFYAQGKKEERNYLMHRKRVKKQKMRPLDNKYLGFYTTAHSGDGKKSWSRN